MIVDQLIKIIHFIMTFTTMTTYDVVDVFMKNVLKIHAWPTKIIDDWDPKFLSEFWTTLFNMCGTKIICTTCFKGEIL